MTVERLDDNCDRRWLPVINNPLETFVITSDDDATTMRISISVLSTLLLLSRPSSSLSFPSSFMPYGVTTNETADPVVSSCACGSLSIRIANVDASTCAIDCHCPRCRHYHVSGFTTYLEVAPESVIWKGDTKATYRDSCGQVGVVDRQYCSRCHTKMATSIVSEEGKSKILINLGPIEDDTVPEEVAVSWQKGRTQWQFDAKPRWPKARPKWQERRNPPVWNLKGGCGCGQSRFKIAFHPPTEFQHCYCRICRQLSGSAFQTWVPIEEEFFRWESPEPNLHRTTSHGQRHVCGGCGSVMTIKYDGQPETIWPAAGSFDDDSLPKKWDELNSCIYRVCHIGVAWKQSWYKLPSDGFERIDFAA